MIVTVYVAIVLLIVWLIGREYGKNEVLDLLFDSVYYGIK